MSWWGFRGFWGDFAKVSKGEKILQTAVPLIEQIDELFFES